MFYVYCRRFTLFEIQQSGRANYSYVVILIHNNFTTSPFTPLHVPRRWQ